MADRICPFCGKTNPEEAEVCQHCQARLISSSNPLPKSPDEAKQELSDWLNSTREDAAKSAGLPDVPSQAAPDGAAQEEAPEWLARIRERSRAEQEVARTASNIFESPEPPVPQAKESRSSKKAKVEEAKKEKPEDSWLEELRDEKETTEEKEPGKAGPGAPEMAPAESDDWVKKLDGWQDSPEAHPGRVKDEHGDWVKPFHSSDLEDLGDHPKQEAPVPAPTKKRPGKKEDSDQSWLEKTRQDAQKSEPPASIPPEEPIPDWLEELETSFPPPEPTKKKGVDKTKTGSGAPPVKTPPEGNIPTGSEEMPDWLKNIRPGSSKKSKPSAPAFIPGHDVVPITPSQPLEEPPKEKPGDLEGLAPAQLPSWLQAMRPVESVLPENLPRGETSGEKGSGALAGLADVIPIQEEATLVSKTSDSTPRLRVDDRQKVQAQLLESVLVEGNKPVEIPKAVQKKGRSAGRILISLLIIIFLAIPIVLGSNSRLMPSPVFFAPETVSMFTAVQTLAPNSRVMVVLDYQPSLAGELQTASLPVIEHLMAKNSGLAFISTTPSGPILANTLAQLAQTATPGFDSANLVVN
ncbi:MAG: hypothetical protein LUO89_05110, partial [Methanothrix sp.]|nr:hypothetical protein [Methanothrix sp.]